MNITVISPSKSSTVIMPYGLPLDFATRCCTLVTSPATVTWSPSCDVLRRQQVVDAGATHASRAGSRARPAGGRRRTGRASRARTRACPSSSTRGGRAPSTARCLAARRTGCRSRSRPRRSPPCACPDGRSAASSWISMSARRVAPSESNAPALISDSTVRLFATCDGHLRRKSWNDVKRPFSSRAATMRVDDVRADVAHGAEAEADVVADGGEVADRLVDVGRQHLDAHAAALVEVHRELVLGVADAREQCGHVLGGIVGLEVGGPVGDERRRRRSAPC